MNKNSKIYIFHIATNEKDFLVLSPFEKVKNLTGVFQEKIIEGRYGSEPDVEWLSRFRTKLYDKIEIEVSRFVSDLRFVSRFLISSAVFFGVFLVLNYAIRDPLIIVDELLGAIAVSIGTYMFLGRKAMQSSIAEKKRNQLRQEVDQIKFTPSSFVTNIEKELRRFNENSPSSVMKIDQESEDIVVKKTDYEEAGQFLDLLSEKYRLNSKKNEKELMGSFRDKRSLLNKIFVSKLLKINNLSPSIVEMSLLKIFYQLKNALDNS